jgi:hypothetical protein
MTAQTPGPTPYPYQRGYWNFSRVLLVVGCILFVLAAFAVGGHPLAGVPAWSWGFGAFAAWMLSGAVRGVVVA